MKIIGIYQIQSKIKPERIYIGSAVSIHKRWGVHLQQLRKNKHHSIKLQRHYNKYGERDLQFSILYRCHSGNNLLNIEQCFLNAYKPYFNICKKAGSSLGIKRSDEYKKKKSEAMKGNKNGFSSNQSPAMKAKARANRNWKPLSPEHKSKISAALKNNNNSLGKKCSESRKAKMRIISKNNGSKPPVHYGNKFRLRKFHSLLTKEKMSLSQNKRRMNERTANN